MQLGLAETGTSGILLTTDADSTPAEDWVARCAAALAQADVVTGRIVREPSMNQYRQDRVERYFDRLYALRRRLDPVPWERCATHHFTGGANMGFRASAYAVLGGFAPITSGEDAAIIDEAARAGLRVRRDAGCIVRTSSRRQGRAPGGMAAMLFEGDSGRAQFVGNPEDAAWQYVRHARARAGYERLDEPVVLDRLARLLMLTPDHVVGVARDCPSAEAFAMRIVPAPPAERTVSLDQAEAALAAIAVPDEAVVA